MSDETLPDELNELISAYGNASVDMATLPIEGTVQVRVAARAALVAAILSYGRAERERGIEEAASRPDTDKETSRE